MLQEFCNSLGGRTMKKSQLVLLTLVPIPVGWLINVLLGLPVIGMASFYVLPFAVLVFWFWLGKQFAKTDWSLAVSMVISSTPGLVSLALYIWQFLFETDETRNIFLALLSQMYGAAVPGYLFGWLARLFESQPHYIGRNSFIALQVIPIVMLLAVFICGYVKEKKD